MQVRAEQLKEGSVPCGCGRSPTGSCIGWHGLTPDQYESRLKEWQKEQEDNQATGE